MTAFMISTIKDRNIIKAMSATMKTGATSGKLSKGPIYSILFPFSRFVKIKFTVNFSVEDAGIAA